MADLRLLLISIVVAIFGVVTYWHLVSANPTVITDPQISRKLSKAASSDSNEEKSREEDLAELAAPPKQSSSRDSSGESSENVDSNEIKVFSAHLVKPESENGTVVVSNIQSWEEPANGTSQDETVIYFLDENGEVDMPAGNFSDVRIAAGNLPCNNGQKNQFFRETDRCNGIYSCDDNSADEMNCPQKCLGFRYPYALDLVDCKAYVPRFFYDYEKQSCHFFVYGGCADVINMFLSKTECERECFGVKLPTKPSNTTTGSIEITLTTTSPEPVITEQVKLEPVGVVSTPLVEDVTTLAAPIEITLTTEAPPETVTKEQETFFTSTPATLAEVVTNAAEKMKIVSNELPTGPEIAPAEVKLSGEKDEKIMKPDVMTTTPMMVIEGSGDTATENSSNSKQQLIAAAVGA